MKQIFLDTETTGLDPNQGHRVIEIAAIEFNNRQLTSNRFHTYINPDREIDPAAQEVHGITLDFLSDKPNFKDTLNNSHSVKWEWVKGHAGQTENERADYLANLGVNSSQE